MDTRLFSARLYGIIGRFVRNPEQVKQLAGEMPVFCIGGINGDTLPQVLAPGAQRVTVVSRLLRQADRTRAVRDLIRTLTPA